LRKIGAVAEAGNVGKGAGLGKVRPFDPRIVGREVGPIRRERAGKRWEDRRPI
jgi:hypothetical protein